MLIEERLLALAATLTCALTVAHVEAGVLALTSVHDNTLYEDPTGSLTNGAGEFMFAGRTSGNVTRRALLSFDFSAIPAGATIDNVTLTLHMSMTSAGATNVSLFRTQSAWGEGTSDAPGGEGAGTAATPGDATWLHTFFNTSLWTTAGGDFAGVASATASVGAVGSYAWSSTQMKLDVQQWIATPASNFGWLVMGDETGPNTSKRFDTRENATVAFRPSLVVEYTVVPAPSALALMAGSMLLGRRRRR